MNLEIAKSGRLAALENRNADRLLVSPTEKEVDMQMPSEGSPAQLIINALSTGLLPEQFGEDAGWSRSRTMVNLYKVAKRTGVGIERRGGKLFAVWPNDYVEVCLH